METLQAELHRELKAAAKASVQGEQEVDAEEGEEEDTEMSEDEEAAEGNGHEGAGKAGGASTVDDEAAMKDIMMTRKTKKFYERVQRAQLGKRERVEALEGRKRALSTQKQQLQPQQDSVEVPPKASKRSRK